MRSNRDILLGGLTTPTDYDAGLQRYGPRCLKVPHMSAGRNKNAKTKLRKKQQAKAARSRAERKQLIRYRRKLKRESKKT
jgi:hypothetical protein